MHYKSSYNSLILPGVGSLSGVRALVFFEGFLAGEQLPAAFPVALENSLALLIAALAFASDYLVLRLIVMHQ